MTDDQLREALMLRPAFIAETLGQLTGPQLRAISEALEDYDQTEAGHVLRRILTARAEECERSALSAFPHDRCCPRDVLEALLHVYPEAHA